MDNIIRLQDYRPHRSLRMPERAHTNFWACGACGCHAWTLAVACEIRCSACGMRAGNLAVVETGSTDLHQ